MSRGAGRTIVAALAICVLAGCGAARQDAQEPTGSFPVQVVSASFPPSQRLSEHTHLVIQVRNTGHRPIPNLTVTICNVTCTYSANTPPGEGTSVAPFSECVGPTPPTGNETAPGTCLAVAQQEGQANLSRPVWVVDRPPGVCGKHGYSCSQGAAGADVTADSNSWQRNTPLAPGATATFDWAVTAVAPGTFTVAWEIAAGQFGKAKAVIANGVGPCGRTPCGTFPVTIRRVPSQSYVNDAGQIVQTSQ
jgi:hypothetical protein